MQQYHTVFINGEPFNCNISMSLQDLLIYLDYRIENILIEYNKQVITSTSFNKLYLNHKDQIEIITIVGGG